MNERPGLDAVVCDAGGTLLRLDFEWMSEDLAAHGFATDPARLRRAEVQGRRDYDASTRPQGAAGPAARGDVRAYFGGTLRAAGLPAAGIAAAVDRLLARERSRGLWCRPMEGARESLDALRAAGLPVAVVSNSDGRAARHLANADLLRGVDFVVDSHLVGVEKPDAAIFRLALDRLGTRADRTLYVGDLRSVDEAGATAAGMRFVLIDPFGDYAPDGEPRIAAMGDLAAWVAGTFAVPGAAPPSRPAGPGVPAPGRRG